MQPEQDDQCEYNDQPVIISKRKMKHTKKRKKKDANNIPYPPWQNSPVGTFACIQDYWAPLN